METNRTRTAMLSMALAACIATIFAVALSGCNEGGNADDDDDDDVTAPDAGAPGHDGAAPPDASTISPDAPAADAGPPALLWAMRVGGVDASIGAADLVVDSDGNIAVSGTFYGTIDFGGTELTNSTGAPDAFVAKYDPAGELIWVVPVSGAGDDYVGALDVDASGDVLATGQSDENIWIARYAAADGETLWDKTVASDGLDGTFGLAVDSGGNAIVTGYYGGEADFGDGIVRGINGPSDAFVAKYDDDGELTWVRAFGDLEPVVFDIEWATAIGVDSDDNVVVAGYYNGVVSFGGPPLTSAIGSFGENSIDVFLVKLDADGEHLWSISHGGSGTFDAPKSLAVDADGSVIVGGFFMGEANFGGNNFTTTGGGDDVDMFVAKYDADGQHVWSAAYGSPDVEDNVNGVSVDSTGHVLLVGSFVQPLDFGGGPLTSAGDKDGYLTKLDADGDYVWSQRIGAATADSGGAIAVAGGDEIIAGGYFGGAVDFGGTSLTSAGVADLFLMRRAP